MALVLSRTLASAPLSYLPPSSPFALNSAQNRISYLRRTTFLPPTNFRADFSVKAFRRRHQSLKLSKKLGVHCDDAVAEKEAFELDEEKFEYQAEVSRLKDLIFHSLYSHKEIFLRELVSNASDALDKLRFLSVTDSSLLGEFGELEICIKTDPENGTVTITDTGIGMTKEELIDCLGTIAQSGTSKFLKALKENKDFGGDNGLIRQFGVDFTPLSWLRKRYNTTTHTTYDMIMKGKEFNDLLIHVANVAKSHDTTFLERVLDARYLIGMSYNLKVGKLTSAGELNLHPFIWEIELFHQSEMKLFYFYRQSKYRR